MLSIHPHSLRSSKKKKKSPIHGKNTSDLQKSALKSSRGANYWGIKLQATEEREIEMECLATFMKLGLAKL